MHASGQPLGGGQPAALASAFHKLNSSSTGGRFGAVPGSSIVVKEGGHGPMMGMYTPVEAITTPSTSSESTGSSVGGRGLVYQSSLA